MLVFPEITPKDYESTADVEEFFNKANEFLKKIIKADAADLTKLNLTYTTFFYNSTTMPPIIGAIENYYTKLVKFASVALESKSDNRDINEIFINTISHLNESLTGNEALKQTIEKQSKNNELTIDQQNKSKQTIEQIRHYQTNKFYLAAAQKLSEDINGLTKLVAHYSNYLSKQDQVVLTSKSKSFHKDFVNIGAERLLTLRIDQIEGLLRDNQVQNLTTALDFLSKELVSQEEVNPDNIKKLARTYFEIYKLQPENTDLVNKIIDSLNEFIKRSGTNSATAYTDYYETLTSILSISTDKTVQEKALKQLTQDNTNPEIEKVRIKALEKIVITKSDVALQQEIFKQLAKPNNNIEVEKSRIDALKSIAIADTDAVREPRTIRETTMKLLEPVHSDPDVENYRINALKEIILNAPDETLQNTALKYLDQSTNNVEIERSRFNTLKEIIRTPKITDAVFNTALAQLEKVHENSEINSSRIEILKDLYQKLIYVNNILKNKANVSKYTGKLDYLKSGATKQTAKDIELEIGIGNLGDSLIKEKEEKIKEAEKQALLSGVDNKGVDGEIFTKIKTDLLNSSELQKLQTYGTNHKNKSAQITEYINKLNGAENLDELLGLTKVTYDSEKRPGQYTLRENTAVLGMYKFFNPGKSTTDVLIRNLDRALNSIIDDEKKKLKEEGKEEISRPRI